MCVCVCVFLIFAIEIVYSWVARRVAKGRSLPPHETVSSKGVAYLDGCAVTTGSCRAGRFGVAWGRVQVAQWQALRGPVCHWSGSRGVFSEESRKNQIHTSFTVPLTVSRFDESGVLPVVATVGHNFQLKFSTRNAGRGRGSTVRRPCSICAHSTIHTSQFTGWRVGVVWRVVSKTH